MDYAALAAQYGGTSTPPAPSGGAVDYAKLAAQYGGTTATPAAKPVTAADMWKREIMGSLPGGVARGIKDVIDTGAGFISRLGGADEQARVRAENDAGKADFAETTEGMPAAGAGRLIGNIVATAPVGGVIASGLSKVPGVAAAAPNLLNAIRTSGMQAGSSNALANAFLRAAGGATAGAASAGLVNPEDAGTGAMIGAVAPGVFKVLGVIGGSIGALFKSGAIKTADDLAKALSVASPAERTAAIEKLRGAAELVPGSRPTVAQALRTPQASTLESIVSDSPGGAAIKERYLAQNAARLGALEGVQPTNAAGLASAREDLGQMVERAVIPERDRLRAFTQREFEDVGASGAEMKLPLPKMRAALDKYLGPGTVGQGAKARSAMAEADKIGMIDLPAVKAAQGEEASLLQFVKANGGINRSAESSADFSGEIRDLMQGELGRFSFKGRGLSLERMAERAREAGMIADEDPVTLINALRDGGGLTATGGGRVTQRAAERSMGDLPQAERVPVAVPWSQIQSLRTSIGDMVSDLVSKGGSTKEVGALTAMKKSLDETMMNAATGKGAAGDYMPPDAMAKYLEANRSFAALKDRFDGGRNADLFRSNGPRGGAIASKFWGNRADLADTVKDFKRLVDENPAMLGQFRSMITTEGASTQTGAGQLTGKFAQWVASHGPGLREAFPEKDVRLLESIAADIRRAAGAAADGASRGSPTFRNAANALDVGLIGSPVVKAVAGKIPFGQAGVNALSESVAKTKARRLAELLVDTEGSANALSAQSVNALQRYLEANPAAVNLLYRASPVGLGVNR